MLEDLEIGSTHLGVEIHDGVDFSVSNQANINLESGGLYTHTFISSKTRIDLGSGSTSGTYALRDLLSVKTTSGSISVEVEPKEADRKHPAPAVF